MKINGIWRLIEITVKEFKKKDPNIILDKTKEKDFYRCFNDLYSLIKLKYMSSEVKYLDRHKVSSIVIISIIESNIIKYSKNGENGAVYFAPYYIATSVGFSFMQSEVNEILLKKKQKTIDKIWTPDLLSCPNVPYIDEFSRNLYYAHSNEKWGLNPLDLSEKLFILEYVTLEKKGINPHILQET